MIVTLKTAPTVEPITLQEVKDYLRISENLASVHSIIQSIANESHIVTTGYTVLGEYADIQDYISIVSFDAGTNGSSGTVDVKIQESDDYLTWTDWIDGAFTQITEATDNATYDKQYTGSKRYIRVVAKILVATCEFGVKITKYNTDVINEDTYLNSLIVAARQYVEMITSRQLITATWEAYLDTFPTKDYIQIPLGNLQKVNSIKYKQSTGTETTMTETTDYIVELNGEHFGRIVVPYGKTWPTPVTYYPSNPITINFDCGYGLASSVPYAIKIAIKMLIADMYENRGERITGQYATSFALNKTAENLLYPYRLWGF